MRSHFGLLSTLSEAPPLAPSVYTDLFHHLKDYGDVYFVCVFIDRSTDQLVASGTLIREKKFIHGGGVSGHIEDIVLSPSVQGRGLGRVMVEGLRELAVGLDCYKVILDCQEGKVREYI
jgi:GNAT superfamily N-acetyltransferase